MDSDILVSWLIIGIFLIPIIIAVLSRLFFGSEFPKECPLCGAKNGFGEYTDVAPGDEVGEDRGGAIGPASRIIYCLKCNQIISTIRTGSYFTKGDDR